MRQSTIAPQRAGLSWPLLGIVLLLLGLHSLDPLSLSAQQLPAAVKNISAAASNTFSPADAQAILARRCLACHNSEQAAGDFVLGAEALTDQALTDRARKIIAPGQPQASELWRRVNSTDPELRMPPKGESLTQDERAAIKRWIESGAAWVGHWAYQPLQRTSPPYSPTSPDQSSMQSPRDPIDLFIIDRQRSVRLSLSPSAALPILARRVSFDLTGLPPLAEELHELRAAEAAGAVDAYERYVERLMARPQSGERAARRWMDLVHFAETHGHDQDRPRPNAWPYRDYLIRAFNEDRPYGHFIRQQIAGDVLEPANPQAIIATGFLAAGPWDESSLRDIREDSIDREIGRYLDRDDIVTTVLNTFASTTVHCARCHDHKFDPISQRDYYNLQAVFSATDKAERAFDADPQISARRDQLTRQLAQLPAQIEAADAALLSAENLADVAQWEREVAAAARQWQVLEAVDVRTDHGSQLTKQPDGSLLAAGARPEKEIYHITVETKAPELTGLRLEVLTDPSLPKQGPGRQDNGNLHLNEIQLTAAPIGDLQQKRIVTLKNPQADFNQAGWSIEMALDRNPATAWGIFPEVGKSHQAMFEFADLPPSPSGWRLTIELQQIHGGGHLIGRPRISVTSAARPLKLDAHALPANITAILAVAPEQRDARQRATLVGHRLVARWQQELAQLPPPQFVYAGTSIFKADGSFRPAGAPRVVKVLHRGDIKQEREEATPAALRCVTGLPGVFVLADPGVEGQRRAALADWLSDPRNSLTWRSIVNRLWQDHFGRGIVDTPSDFGAMGSQPTHPALLDWLATTLLAEEQSLKSLRRRLVTTTTYRQSSGQRAEMQELDGDNRLLWRMPRTRLDAESVHDAVAQIAGTLDLRMGGPSVKQFIQINGPHVTPTVDYQNFSVDDPANYRRSVYRFIFRTVPDPFMESLDCPDASQWTPVRNVSVTALQALAMLNDKFVVRQCQRIADRVAAESGDAQEQVRILMRLILAREPNAAEQTLLERYLQRHGLANAARWLLNTNEFMFID
jgi:mono/diheme cytochrome c family protein